MSHTDRPAIAVVGAGPSGLFACQALLRAEPPIGRIDVYDRLPTPYGLLRYGVAPDHVGIKSVASRLATVFEDPRVRSARERWGRVAGAVSVTSSLVL